MPEVPGYGELAEIGRGRHSTVFRARELGTGRLVAIKVVDVHGVSGDSLNAFRREATALATLGQHPHIVTMYCTVELVDGSPALVLELCNGSLADVLANEGPVSPRRATTIGVKVAGALETAHRAGVLHLDVCPANILVTGFGEPALTDFGIARLLTGGHAGAPLPSTIGHAAPELVEGAAVGPASDVYQLAATIHHLLTGRPPFEAFADERPAAVALRILSGPPPPLPSATAPAVLADLLRWAMAGDPADRPQSAGSFADALRSVELTCGWAPTAPAIPGGLMPRLAVPGTDRGRRTRPSAPARPVPPANLRPAPAEGGPTPVAPAPPAPPAPVAPGAAAPPPSPVPRRPPVEPAFGHQPDHAPAPRRPRTRGTHTPQVTILPPARRTAAPDGPPLAPSWARDVPTFRLGPARVEGEPTAEHPAAPPEPGQPHPPAEGTVGPLAPGQPDPLAEEQADALAEMMAELPAEGAAPPDRAPIGDQAEAVAPAVPEESTPLPRRVTTRARGLAAIAGPPENHRWFWRRRQH